MKDMLLSLARMALCFACCFYVLLVVLGIIRGFGWVCLAFVAMIVAMWCCASKEDLKGTS